MKARLMAMIVLAAVAIAGAFVRSKGADEPKRIEIHATKYSFTPSEITLKKGQPVILVLTSDDVTHGLKVSELNIKVEVKKGHPEEVPITPTQTGHFVGKCAHFCGKGHGSMTLAIDVVE
jgi:cytochrome c oxidase subunit II